MNRGHIEKPIQNQNEVPNVGLVNRGNMNEQIDVPPLIVQGVAALPSQMQRQVQNLVSQSGENLPPLNVIAPSNRTYYLKNLEEGSCHHHSTRNPQGTIVGALQRKVTARRPRENFFYSEDDSPLVAHIINTPLLKFKVLFIN